MASDLGLHCLRTSHKKEARLIWLKPKKCEPNRTAFEMEVLLDYKYMDDVQICSCRSNSMY